MVFSPDEFNRRKIINGSIEFVIEDLQWKKNRCKILIEMKPILIKMKGESKDGDLTDKKS